MTADLTPLRRVAPSIRGLLLTLLILAPALGANARETPSAEPETLGFAADRLARLDVLVRQAVEAGEVAGAVVLVQRHGQVAYLKAFGKANVESGRDLRPDDLFRLASMTKAVTTVGAMMLFEEGRFLLSDPVGRYLPSFDKTFEVFEPAEFGYVRVPAKRPITIRDLMTHTSGLSYRFMNLEPLGELYIAADLDDGLSGEDMPLAEFVRQLAEFPLAHHPGERWTYGLNTDVLGRLVEVLSGQSLDAFLAERVFAPLGMTDTFFEVPDTHRDRVAAVHRFGAEGRLEVIPPGIVRDGPVKFSVDYPYDGRIGLLSGGGGLVSTASDYGRLLQMLLNDGELDGTRLLGRKTVALMRANQTGHLDAAGFGAAGFSLGFGLNGGPESGRIGSAGSLGWGGFFSTDMWFDPDEDMLGVLMTQHYPYGHDLMSRYKVPIYQALED